jgi:hypothetical protein
LHPCHQDDERHQVEAELGGCCLVVEELDDHLAQCAPSVRSAQQAHSLPRVLAAQQALQVLAAQQAQCVQLVQAT